MPAGGRLITLEYDPRYAEVARTNIAKAALPAVVEVRVGRALDTLPRLAAEGIAPFDFIFIDADKEGYPNYFTWALRLSRKDTVIIADNVVRKGAVVDADSADSRVQGVRRMNALIAGLRRLHDCGRHGRRIGADPSKTPAPRPTWRAPAAAMRSRSGSDHR
jgi:predicted O-methyltransferase YrrM